jgi:phage terminase large subunit GpA-like protein
MPLCPHCEKAVTLESTKKDSRDEVKKEVEGFIKREVMYSCPHCDKVLGFAFFFGGRATGRP